MWWQLVASIGLGEVQHCPEGVRCHSHAAQAGWPQQNVPHSAADGSADFCRSMPEIQFESFWRPVRVRVGVGVREAAKKRQPVGCGTP